MPGWLQALARNQPITPMVNAVRSLAEGPASEGVIGHAVGHDVVASLLWSIALVAVFAPIAVLRYRRG